MILLSIFGLFPALLGITADQPAEQQVVRRMVVRDEIILRIPIRPRPSRPIEWKEGKGPRCLDTDRLAGAMLSGPSSIDFVLRDRRRFRAHMDSECPALDFYNGFYLQPEDDRICARRDFVHSRVGGDCRIERFKSLEPKVRR